MKTIFTTVTKEMLTSFSKKDYSSNKTLKENDLIIQGFAVIDNDTLAFRHYVLDTDTGMLYELFNRGN